MLYTIKHIAQILQCDAILPQPAQTIEHLLTDSRKVIIPQTSLFFALGSNRRSGSEFIKELYQNNVINFVVSKDFDCSPFYGANFIKPHDGLRALQQLAAWHRGLFNIPVIGITGSNGKTMVKEWLYQLLHFDFNIVRSPKSFNSQVGVPLSVWQMNEDHTLAIFEAGISQTGEMEHLENMIRPTAGVITNLGEAHIEGFANGKERALEKIKLFKRSRQLVYCPEALTPDLSIDNSAPSLFDEGLQAFEWSRNSTADLIVDKQVEEENSTTIHARLKGVNENIQITIPFLDHISIDNAITCWSVMLTMGYRQNIIRERMLLLTPLEMRMQMKKGVNNCTIINDSYSNDLSSLELALSYLRQQSAGRKTTLIISDILQSGLNSKELAIRVNGKAQTWGVKRLICIGPLLYNNSIVLQAGLQPKETEEYFYPSTEALLQQFKTSQFRDEVVLLKGARVFEFERISHWLEEKTHQTILEVNLTAIAHNLKQYQQFVKPSVKIMAMVKAFSYGSGSAEVANVLQFHKADYLAVAYADEGVELRKANIRLPVLVMSPEKNTFDFLVEYNLEPELYSFGILKAFDLYLQQQGIMQFPVHIKIDTGMHRLGFETHEIGELLQLLITSRRLFVKSVFSHLAASENGHEDAFTSEQAGHFIRACNEIEKGLGYKFSRHISNSAAILRHPDLQFEMVRLGIGLYGVNNSSHSELQLQTVATLKSTIAQIRKVKAGESVGYSRKGMVNKDRVIATIRIGYADGFSRSLSDGIGKIYVNGHLAPVAGNVCMDMTMIDITGIPGLQEGDSVEVFGPNLPIEVVAEWAGTIPYEIMTGISQRVKRVYYEE